MRLSPYEVCDSKLLGAGKKMCPDFGEHRMLLIEKLFVNKKLWVKVCLRLR